jgi:hypothetical protein
MVLKPYPIKIAGMMVALNAFDLKNGALAGIAIESWYFFKVSTATGSWYFLRESASWALSSGEQIPRQKVRTNQIRTMFFIKPTISR